MTPLVPTLDLEVCFDRPTPHLQKRLIKLAGACLLAEIQPDNEAQVRSELVVLLMAYPRWWNHFHLVRAIVHDDEYRYLRQHPTLWNACAGGSLRQLADLHAHLRIQALLRGIANMRE